MTDDEILLCLTEILARLLDDPTLAVRPEDEMRSLSGWNEFIELNLLAVAESRFGVSFAPVDTTDLRTVGDLVDLVARRQGSED